MQAPPIICGVPTYKHIYSVTSQLGQYHNRSFPLAEMLGYVMVEMCNHVTACLGRGRMAELKVVVTVTWAGRID